MDKYGIFFFLRHPKRLYGNIQNDWLTRRPFDVLCSALFLFHNRFTTYELHLHNNISMCTQAADIILTHVPTIEFTI